MILFVVVGGAFSFAAIAVFMRSRLSRVSAFVAGTVVLVWIAVQLAIIGYVSWMQPATFATGLFILVLALRLSSPSAANVAKPTKSHLN